MVLLRQWQTDCLAVRTTLSRLLNPGAWRKSQTLPDSLREELDKLERTKLKEGDGTAFGRYGFDTALQAMEEVKKLGRHSSANSVVLATRSLV